MRTDHMIGRAALLAGVCALALASQARAQQASATPQVARTVEVVVTARRRAESLSKTPMAITALTGQQLVEAGVVNINQLQYLAPSLTVQQGRQGVELTLRGVSTTDQSTKGEPDIAFNIDGVPNLRSEEQALAMFDLQRVEVLSGPQSTLYGVASTGGDVNIISNAPTWTQAAGGTFEIGNYATHRVQAMVNEPINDTLAFRAAISYNQRSGFIRLIGAQRGNDPGDENNFSRRLTLLARFNSDFTVRLSETGGTLGGVGQYSSMPITATGSGSTLIGHASAVGYTNPFQGSVNDNWEMPTLQVDDAVGPVHLGLISSYNYYHEDTITPDYNISQPDEGPWSGGANNGGRFWIRERFQTYFEELRASNQNPDDRIQYVAGINYLWQQNNEDGHGFQINNSAPAPILPDYSTTFEPVNLTTQTSASAFVHTITAITPQLHLTLGLRESFDRDDRVGTFAIGDGFGAPWPTYSGAPCVGTEDCLGVNDTGGQKSSALSYNTGLDYQITPAQLIYVNANKGYKPGGFNDPQPDLPGGTAPYGAETLYAYELGYKLALPAGIRFNTDFFYYDYSGEQINEPVPGGISYTALHPTSEYGSESALTYPVTGNDIVNVTADFLHGTYSAGNGAITGWTLSNMPKAVIGAGYTHYWSLADGATVKFHANTRWSSSYLENDIGSNVNIEQPSFTRSDADISYITPNGKFTTQAFVTNIENKIQFTSASEGATGDLSTVTGAITLPRFWGVRETVKF